MLILGRNEGQWIELTHRSGDVVRIHVREARRDSGGLRVELVFDDPERHFEIERPERKAATEATSCAR